MHITIVEKACATASMYAFYKDGCFHISNLPMGICGEATMAGETGVTRPGVPGVHGWTGLMGFTGDTPTTGDILTGAAADSPGATTGVIKTFGFGMAGLVTPFWVNPTLGVIRLVDPNWPDINAASLWLIGTVSGPAVGRDWDVHACVTFKLPVQYTNSPHLYSAYQLIIKWP